MSLVESVSYVLVYITTFVASLTSAAFIYGRIDAFRMWPSYEWWETPLKILVLGAYTVLAYYHPSNSLVLVSYAGVLVGIILYILYG